MMLPEPPPLQVLPAPVGINHGAGLLALSATDLLACWYSGRSEAGPDAVILCSNSRDGGARWSAVERASVPRQTDLTARAPAKSVGNVVLARGSVGRIVMIAGEIQSRCMFGIETCTTWRCGRISFRIASGLGGAWSAPTRLDDRQGALPRSRPIHVEGQGDLLPVYQESGRPSVLRLDLASLTPGRRPALLELPIPATTPLIQPTLVAAPGRSSVIWAYLRDPRRRFVYASAYDPSHGAWSPAAPTDLANPGSAVEAFQDARGRIVLIHNRGRGDRRTLSVSFSVDGLHFPNGCDLVERDTAGEAAYPSISQIDRQAWGVVFSIEGKRRIAFARLDQGFLDACAARAR